MVNLIPEFEDNVEYIALRKLHTGAIIEGRVFIYKRVGHKIQVHVNWDNEYNPSEDWYAIGYVENIWLDKVDPQRLAFIKVGEDFERDKLAAVMRFN